MLGAHVPQLGIFGYLRRQRQRRHRGVAAVGQGRRRQGRLAAELLSYFHQFSRRVGGVMVRLPTYMAHSTIGHEGRLWVDTGQWSGVRPWRWTVSGSWNGRLPGVLLLKLHGAEIAERRVQPSCIINVIDESGKI